MEAKTIQKYQSKSIPVLRKRAKYYFNLFIRLRDTDDNGFGKCISSGHPLRFADPNIQAGHFYSAGKFPNMEFNEDNVNVQGKSDNYFNGGNLLQYRRNLVKKIGGDAVDSLDWKAEMYKRNGYKQDRFFLIEVIEKYLAKCKELANEKMFEVKI